VGDFFVYSEVFPQNGRAPLCGALATGAIRPPARLAHLAEPSPPPSPQACRLGVLAFGDSITNGGGEPQWGVACQSWAHWVARALGLPYTGYAIDGNKAADVIRTQIPHHLSRSAHPDARYELGCLYIGVNDVRSPEWNPASYASDFRHALAFLHERCDRVLALTAPLDLGRPLTGDKVEELNHMVESIAAETHTLLAHLEDFGARNQMMVDHVHPTAFGQIAIAERALEVLQADGMTVHAAPHNMVHYEITRWNRLRGDATYAYRHSKVSLKAAALSSLARTRPGARRA
jgi:lysophospholipase L1-like esterase